MSERAAWITAGASILAAVLGAILGRPVINQVVGTTEKIERLTEENQELRRESSDSTALKKKVVELEGQLAECKNTLVACGNLPHTTEQSAASAPQTSALQKLQPSAPMVIEESGYSFSLLGCDRSGSSVTCNLTIENRREE
jgi:hypothetical protein